MGSTPTGVSLSNGGEIGSCGLRRSFAVPRRGCTLESFELPMRFVYGSNCQPMRSLSSSPNTFGSNDHLTVPTLYGRGLKARFWFREDAYTMIRRAWRIAWTLRAYGLCINVRWTCAPGEIVYEDALQVAAIPRAEHGSRLRRY